MDTTTWIAGRCTTVSCCDRSPRFLIHGETIHQLIAKNNQIDRIDCIQIALSQKVSASFHHLAYRLDCVLCGTGIIRDTAVTYA